MSQGAKSLRTSIDIYWRHIHLKNIRKKELDSAEVHPDTDNDDADGNSDRDGN